MPSRVWTLRAVLLADHVGEEKRRPSGVSRTGGRCPVLEGIKDGYLSSAKNQNYRVNQPLAHVPSLNLRSLYRLGRIYMVRRTCPETGTIAIAIEGY